MHDQMKHRCDIEADVLWTGNEDDVDLTGAICYAVMR